MRRLKRYELEREAFESAILKYRDHRSKSCEVELACGLRDEVEVFREGALTYALSWNDGLGYVGIECFQGTDKLDDIFLQNSQDVEAVLGKRGLDLTPMNMAKRMAMYLNVHDGKRSMP